GALGYRHRRPLGHEARATAPGPYLGEFRTEQEDLGGVVDPHHDDDEGAGRAVRGGHRAPAEVEPDEELADSEEERGDRRAEADTAPGHLHGGQELEDEREG